MNEGQLTDKVMERRDLPPMAKVIMRAIIRRVDWKTWSSKEGHKVVSTRELALRCGTTQSTVCKNIARLEKAGLIQRDFFKAKATKAPPIKVLVDNILEYTGDIESMSQGDIESISPTDIESMSLSIKDNSNTIINTINYTPAINPSLSKEYRLAVWGVSSEELWGNELVDGLSIVSSKGKSK